MIELKNRVIRIYFAHNFGLFSKRAMPRAVTSLLCVLDKNM